MERRHPLAGLRSGPEGEQGWPEPGVPREWGAGAGESLRPALRPQFFVMLLLVFLLEATVAILFFAYTDKVQPPVPTPPHRRARGCDTAGDSRVGGLGMAVMDDSSPVI